MAKNLKLNVKNAQLAQALKLVKKPAAKREKSDEGAPAVEEAVSSLKAAEPNVVERAVDTTFESLPPEPPKSPEIAASPPPVKEEVAAEESPKKEAVPSEPQRRPPSTTYRPYQERKPYTPGERKPYPPREGGFERKRYPEGGQKPPYPPRNGERRPYPPREGGFERKPYPYREGERKPYPPRTGESDFKKPYTPRPDFKRPFQPRTTPHPEFKRAFPTKPGEGERRAPPREAPFKKPAAPGGRGARGEESDESKKSVGYKDFKEFKAQRKAAQQNKAFDSRDRLGLRDDLDDQMWRKKRAHKQRVVIQEEVIRPKNLKVRLPISIKDLAAEMKLKSSQLIQNLFMKGVVLTLNDFLDDETTIQLLGHDFDCEISIDTSEEERIRITDKTIKQEIQESSPELLMIRSPVVAFMGHVDHGKTSLIDTIRKTNTAAGETGAITQHIGAFKCHTAVGDITILDTPGHEAFSAMRERGADVTDIVVLVIAGDEGMRTQTLEALAQAKAANVTIVVAINKSDKPNFNAENVYRELSEHELLPEAWGGQTITINCSAVTGDGIESLVEMLALQAEILELKANPNMRARGTVIESEMHKGLGTVATVLVQNGTLRLGDAVVFSQNYARIKTMHDEFNRELTHAGPSTPVKITGLSGLPEAGSEFIVVKDEKEAKELSEKRIEGRRFQQQQQTKRITSESFMNTPIAPAKKILNLIIRADVQGSVEALKNSLTKIPSQKVECNIILSGVGEISESDVQLAHASKATIIGFHTQIESHAASLIKELKVNVKLHDIIYHAVDDVKSIMEALLDKLAQENEMGEAIVKATFKASQLGIIAGCMVTNGVIRRSASIRVVRDGQVVWKGAIASLKKVKEDVREVSKDHECGILLQNFNDVKVGDLLQAFEVTYLKQEL